MRLPVRCDVSAYDVDHARACGHRAVRNRDLCAAPPTRSVTACRVVRTARGTARRTLGLRHVCIGGIGRHLCIAPVGCLLLLGRDRRFARAAETADAAAFSDLYAATAAASAAVTASAFPAAAFDAPAASGTAASLADTASHATWTQLIDARALALDAAARAALADALRAVDSPWSRTILARALAEEHDEDVRERLTSDRTGRVIHPTPAYADES